MHIPQHLDIAVRWSWYLVWHMLVPFFAAFYPIFSLQSSQWTFLLTTWCLTLYCYFARPDSFSVWHIVHFSDICCSSIASSIQFVCRAWSWAVVMMASVPFFIHPIFSHCHNCSTAIPSLLFLNLSWRLFSVDPLVLLPCIFIWHSSFVTSFDSVFAPPFL